MNKVIQNPFNAVGKVFKKKRRAVINIANSHWKQILVIY